MNVTQMSRHVESRDDRRARRFDNVFRLTIERVLRIAIERTRNVKVVLVENIVSTKETCENRIALFEHGSTQFGRTTGGHVMKTLKVIVETTGFAFARASVVNRKNAEQTTTGQRTTTAIQRH